MQDKNFYKTSDPYLSNLSGQSFEKFEPYVNAVIKATHSEDKILDLGCGTGFSTSLIRIHRPFTIGSDLSVKFLKKSLDNYLLPLVTADAYCLPFPDESFDCVTSHAFIEHVLDVNKVLLEMARIVKPGGSIVVAAPNLISPFMPIRAIIYLVTRGAGVPVFAENYKAATARFIKNVTMTISKMARRNISFSYRNPAYKSMKGDADAAYLANPIELTKFFKKRGFHFTKLHSGRTTFGLLVGKFFPFLSSFFILTVRKS